MKWFGIFLLLALSACSFQMGPQAAATQEKTVRETKVATVTPAPTLTPTPFPTPFPVRRVSVEHLYVRSCPGLQCPVIGILEFGQAVTVYDRLGMWICIEQHRQWVNGNYTR